MLVLILIKKSCVQSLVCGEGCCEEWWVAPHWVFPADEHVVACIHCQRRNVLQELFKLQALLAEFVERLEPGSVILDNIAPCTNFKGTDVGRQLRNIPQEVGVLVFLVPVGIGE